MAAISKQILYKNILKHLKTNPYGLSSTDLARNLNINRMTLVKYLNIMQANGLIEYRNIGMAKVWHITSKYDLINSILRGESAPIQAIIAGQHIKIRNEMGDMIPLSLFRVIKAALSLSKNPSKTQYEAGQLVAKNSIYVNQDLNAESAIKTLARVFIGLRLGIILPLQVSPSFWVLKLNESATSHGTGVKGNSLCHFEAGVISGIISKSLGVNAVVKETKCIGTNHHHCEFAVKFTKK